MGGLIFRLAVFLLEIEGAPFSWHRKTSLEVNYDVYA